MSCPAESEINVFPSQNRIVAVGDIHGDLGALEYCLLYAAQVIDKQWNWRGQNTFVVVVGDLIHRFRPDHTYLDQDEWGIGEVPNEELLILQKLSDLDKKARKAGGRVLKLVGNHEMMELMDQDLRYVTPHGRKMPERRKRLLEALDRCAIFGILQIGNWLFAHGGIIEETLKLLPQGKNFFKEVQRQAQNALLSTNSKKEHPVLESVLWDRTWSDKSNINCQRLNGVLQLLVPHLQELGFPVDAKDMHLVVAHSVQNHKTTGYVHTEVIANLKNAVIFGGPLEKKQGMPMGINGNCDGQLYMIDTGMSRSFDAKGDGDDVGVLWARRPQVLEILGHGSFVQVAVSKKSLPRPATVYSHQNLEFPAKYLTDLGFDLDHTNVDTDSED